MVAFFIIFCQKLFWNLNYKNTKNDEVVFLASVYGKGNVCVTWIYHCFVDFSAYWAHQWKQIPTVCGVLKIGQIMYIFEKLWWKLKEPPFYGKWAQKLQNFR